GESEGVGGGILGLRGGGGFEVNAHRVPLVRQSRAEDPLVQRGRAEGLGPRFLQTKNAANPAPIQPTSFQQERQFVLPPTVMPGSSQSAPPPSRNLQPTPPLPRPPVGAPSPRGAVTPPATQIRICCYAPPGDWSSIGPTSAGQNGSDNASIPPPAQGGPAPARPTSLPGDGPQPPQPDGPATATPRAPDGSVPPSGPTSVPPGTPPLPPPSR